MPSRRRKCRFAWFQKFSIPLTWFPRSANSLLWLIRCRRCNLQPRNSTTGIPPYRGYWKLFLLQQGQSDGVGYIPLPLVVTDCYKFAITTPIKSKILKSIPNGPRSGKRNTSSAIAATTIPVNTALGLKMNNPIMIIIPIIRRNCMRSSSVVFFNVWYDINQQIKFGELTFSEMKPSPTLSGWWIPLYMTNKP